MKKVFEIIIYVLLVSLAFTACDSDRDNTIKEYVISYSGNGNTEGTVPEDSTVYTKGATVTVLANSGKLKKINIDGISYKFVGWNTEEDGNGITYWDDDNTFSINSDTVLYAKWIPYSAGDIGPAGGYIFYDKGAYSDGWRYIEVSLNEIEPMVLHNWCDHESFIVTNAIGTEIGTGKGNTELIIGVQSQADCAAQICADHQEGNYEEWYLPSVDELYQIYVNLYLNDIGNFKDSSYWSSSEVTNVAAWMMNFNIGIANDNVSKNSEVYVRAIRYF